ncbi:hypothetical protein, partial [Vibrio vulnificus]|uniref:hypothetical protein n=1 Tax=Vibrio vulnificus TaxID=672 RepID=UPI003242F45F
AYHFQQLASSSTPIHECRTYYLKSGFTSEVVDCFATGVSIEVILELSECVSSHNRFTYRYDSTKIKLVFQKNGPAWGH